MIIVLLLIVFRLTLGIWDCMKMRLARRIRPIIVKPIMIGITILFTQALMNSPLSYNTN
jgi:putative effector of murein hydrolase